MDKILTYWEAFLQFLKKYDSTAIAGLIRGIDWVGLVRSPVTWGIGMPLLLLLIWKKQLKLLVLGISLVLFVSLLQDTLAAPIDNLSIEKVAEFIGGSIALAAVNFYFFFLRDS